MKEIKYLKYAVALLLLALCVTIGINISTSDRIESLESIIAVSDSLEAYKQAAIQRNNAIKAWQFTAYSMIAFNAGDIEADSMLTVLQFNFKPGSAIIDLWIRSVSSSKGSNKNIAPKAKRN